MKKNKVWLLCLIAGIFSATLASGTPPVGCEQIPSFLHCWNQGSIAADTYFNITSGFLQHANLPERTGDVTYTYGYGTVSGGVPTVHGTNIVPNTLRNRTDNATYYWADAEYTQTQGQNTFTLHKNHTQSLTDNYVNVRFSFQASRRITGNNYFFHGLAGLDVARDGKADLITFAFENGSVEEFNSSLLTNFSRDITKVVIDGGPGTYSYVLDFGKNVTMWYTTGGVSGSLLFGEYIGTINADQLYTYSYLWIDAACSISCSGLGSVVVTDGADWDEIDQYQTKSRSCKYVILRPGRGDNCTISNDCTLQIDRNTSSVTWTAITSTANAGLRCGNQTACTKQANLIATNTWYTFNLSGYIPLPETSFKMTNTRCSISGQVPDYELEVTTWLINPNVTLWTPLNNTVINQTVPWLVFGCNWTGRDAPQILRLKFNGTTNYTVAGAPAPNLSVNISFDSYAGYNWTCEAVEYGHGHDAWNGPRFFWQIFIGAVTGQGGVIKLPPERRDPFRQLDVEDKGILAIGAGVILVGVFLTFWRAKSTKQGDLVAKYSEEIKK